MSHFRSLFTKNFASGQNARQKNRKREIYKHPYFKKRLALFLLVTVIVCGAAKYSEQHIQKSDTDLLSPDEIKFIFIDLDRKANELLVWVNFDYNNLIIVERTSRS